MLKPQDLSAIGTIIREFARDPREHSKTLAAIGKREGYEHIKPTVLNLWESCRVSWARDYLVMLRQPDWEWRGCETRHTIFFGVKSKSEFMALGRYVTGPQETGNLVILNIPGMIKEHVIGEVCKDPRGSYVSQVVKPKVYRDAAQYYVVLVGRFIDLVRRGIDKATIELTHGRGYLGSSPAFARVGGPFNTAGGAREAKTNITI
jgi:hypothetical protein